MKTKRNTLFLALTMPDSLKDKVYEAAENTGLSISTLAREGLLLRLSQLSVELTAEDQVSTVRGWKPGRVRGARKHVTGRGMRKVDGGVQ